MRNIILNVLCESHFFFLLAVGVVVVVSPVFLFLLPPVARLPSEGAGFEEEAPPTGSRLLISTYSQGNKSTQIHKQFFF